MSEYSPQRQDIHDVPLNLDWLKIVKSLKINKSHTIDFQYEGNNSSLIININSDGKLYFQLFIDKGDYYFESLEDLKGILDTYNVNYNSTL